MVASFKISEPDSVRIFTFIARSALNPGAGKTFVILDKDPISEPATNEKTW